MSENTSAEPIPVNDSPIPAGILDAAFEFMRESGIIDVECLLHEVETDTGAEWWLIDDQAELIEAFWLE